jgi:hypothetical protein
MRSSFVFLSVLAGILASGCTMRGGIIYVEEAPNGSNPGSGNADGGSGTTTGTPTGLGDGGLDLGDSGPIGVPTDDCSDASKLVYVVSRENDLYSLRPDAVVLTHIGSLTCPAQPDTFPFSMAVDRSGTAWVVYSDGTLFAVSTTDASCKATSFVPNQAGFSVFGMGFASNGVGASTDTLYVSENVNGHGLGTIDLTTMKLTALGPYTGALAGQKAELTGNGNGLLYGFFLTDPAQVAQIDATGAIASAAPLSTVTVGTDWAFSFWGGDFYLYTGNSTDTAENGSKITRYRPSDGSVTVISPGIGFFIEGAGVSTCAPTTPPPPITPK